MRPYPRNSPRAAARVVALTLLADGQLQRAELAALDTLRAHERLGLARTELHAVVRGLCADLLEDARAAGDDDCLITPALLQLLLADIDDQALQRRVLGLCAEVVRADARVDPNESIVLDAASEQWGLVPAGLASPRRGRTVPA